MVKVECGPQQVLGITPKKPQNTNEKEPQIDPCVFAELSFFCDKLKLCAR